jgi:kinesin family member 15
MWQQNLGGYLQADVFDLVGLPMIENALDGFNTSLVCYG